MAERLAWTRPNLWKGYRIWGRSCVLFGSGLNSFLQSCLPDWLHAVDQGIGADIAGQILVELADQQPARAFKGRVALLWEEIKGLYKEFDVEYRLASLTPGVLNKDQKKQRKLQLSRG